MKERRQRMKCYACGKEEEVRRKGRNLVSDIGMVEVGPAGRGFTDGEGAYMPLCRKCLRKYRAGRLKGIERRWQAEAEESGSPCDAPKQGHAPPVQKKI
jgi:hypothetical protein